MKGAEVKVIVGFTRAEKTEKEGPGGAREGRWSELGLSTCLFPCTDESYVRWLASTQFGTNSGGSVTGQGSQSV